MDRLRITRIVAVWAVTGAAVFAVAAIGGPVSSDISIDAMPTAQPDDCSEAMYCVVGGTNPWLPYGTNPMVPWGSNPQIPGGPGHYSSGWDLAS
ncbi:hypothetical protein [Mycobacteroides chelonae]|uniref:hypothetical protein n=1 Tax=Mycobacteroides chelonae TaxID=1774 RepID=UPI000F514B3D|nr:hypothetical protein [Mycobacteroides chelonae]TDZ91644.1 hypothetical protein CCUG62472_03541 [Mycobacteroides salmoniphilum]